MIHTIIVFIGLAIGSVAYGMELADTSRYFMPGPKDVSGILLRVLRRQVPEEKDARVLALVSKKLYNAFMQAYFMPGPKDVRCALLRGLRRQVRDREDVRSLVLPVGLTCKTFYKQFNNIPFVQNMIARCAFATGKSRGSVAVQLKIRPAERYFGLNNKPYMATITKNFDDKALEYVFSWLELGGADPNFSRPGFGMTLLMRAVTLNCIPFVQLLLFTYGADANVCNSKGIQARACNFIYDRKALAHVVDSIDYKFRLKKSSDLFQQKPFDPEYEAFANVDMQELKNALLIDKFFEDKKAQSVCDEKSNPLLIALKTRDSFRSGIIKEMYSNSVLHMKLYTPKWLYDFLWAPGQ